MRAAIGIHTARKVNILSLARISQLIFASIVKGVVHSCRKGTFGALK